MKIWLCILALLAFAAPARAATAPLVCGGVNDNAAIQAAIDAASSSATYAVGPVRVAGDLSATAKPCAIVGPMPTGDGIDLTGFPRFGNGSRVILADLVFTCRGAGMICLDALASKNVAFEDVTLIGDASDPPMIGLQEGNWAPGTNPAFPIVACCVNSHRGLQIWGSFTFAAANLVGAESTSFDDGSIVANVGAGRGIITGLANLVGGAGYANGTFRNVPLIQGSGWWANADITVSGGAVTSVNVTRQGREFAVGDVLTASGLGPGAGFSVAVASIGQFALVLDGQNHWGVNTGTRSQTIFDGLNAGSWPLDSYATFTEVNLNGGSIRGFGTATPVWLASLLGAEFHRVYIAAQHGQCLTLFDNNATNTPHNVALRLNVECEVWTAPSAEILLSGSNPAPALDGLALEDHASTVATAIFALDPGVAIPPRPSPITALSAPGATLAVHPAGNPALYAGPASAFAGLAALGWRK